MKEKILIIFIALTIGLLITTGAFYIYQTTKPINSNALKNPIAATTSPQITNNKQNTLLEITDPKDEALVDRRALDVKGKTDPTHVIIITTPSEDIVTTPESDGRFSVNVAIDTGVNTVVIRSIDQNGETLTQERTVTHTTEEF